MYYCAEHNGLNIPILKRNGHFSDKKGKFRCDCQNQCQLCTASCRVAPVFNISISLMWLQLAAALHNVIVIIMTRAKISPITS